MGEQDHMASRDLSHAGGVKPSREAELQALLARVEAATGSDRELDAALVKAAGEWMPHMDLQPWTVARLTASLDAALALVERVLPGSSWCISQEPTGVFATSIQMPPFGMVFEKGASAPLSVCAALLKALIAEAASPESGSTGVWTNQSPTPLSKTEVQS